MCENVKNQVATFFRLCGHVHSLANLSYDASIKPLLFQPTFSLQVIIQDTKLINFSICLIFVFLILFKLNPFVTLSLKWQRISIHWQLLASYLPFFLITVFNYYYSSRCGIASAALNSYYTIHKNITRF